MTWLALAALAALALAPLLATLFRGRATRDRREAALASHRAQLAEIDRDLAEGRIAATEHAAAMLEVQRRLLAADALPPEAQQGEQQGGGRRRDGRWPVLAGMVAVPLAAAGLYLVHGRPDLPAAPLSARLAQSAKEDALVAELRARLRTPGLDPERQRQGYVLLGNSEETLGHLPEAADAWRAAVRLRFEPGLAALAAEAQTQVAGGHVSMDSAELFRRALDSAPPDAPWRGLAEQRVREASR